MAKCKKPSATSAPYLLSPEAAPSGGNEDAAMLEREHSRRIAAAKWNRLLS